MKRGPTIGLGTLGILVGGLVVSAPGHADEQSFSTDGLRLHAPIRSGRLVLFPVSFTRAPAPGPEFLLLDEGLRHGLVTITELSSRHEAPAGGEAVTASGQSSPNPPLQESRPTPGDRRAETEQESESGRRRRPPALEPGGLQPLRQSQANREGRPSGANREVQQQVSDGARVNTLAIRNQSDRPLYLLAGEVIHGARQDRIIAHDTVIAPRSDRVDLDVFCVEAGRWREVAPTFSSANAVAGPGIRSTAQVDKAQGRVWEQVSRYNKAVGAGTETDTFRAALEQQEVQRAVAGHLETVAPRLVSIAHLAGVVVAVDGTIVGADLFGVEGMFERLQEKLLTGYVLDAVAFQGAEAPARGAAVPDTSPRRGAGEVSEEDARKYLQAVLSAPTAIDRAGDSQEGLEQRVFEVNVPAGEGGGRKGGHVRGVRLFYGDREVHLNSFR